MPNRKAPASGIVDRFSRQRQVFFIWERLFAATDHRSLHPLFCFKNYRTTIDPGTISAFEGPLKSHSYTLCATFDHIPNQALQKGPKWDMDFRRFSCFSLLSSGDKIASRPSSNKEKQYMVYFLLTDRIYCGIVHL